ncbi:hypothetical protein ACT407_01280 [Acinetobacter baumannii]
MSAYFLKHHHLFKLVDEKWQLQNKQKSYQCARGKGSKGFQMQLCS